MLIVMCLISDVVSVLCGWALLGVGMTWRVVMVMKVDRMLLGRVRLCWLTSVSVCVVVSRVRLVWGDRLIVTFGVVCEVVSRCRMQLISVGDRIICVVVDCSACSWLVLSPGVSCLTRL